MKKSSLITTILTTIIGIIMLILMMTFMWMKRMEDQLKKHYEKKMKSKWIDYGVVSIPSSDNKEWIEKVRDRVSRRIGTRIYTISLLQHPVTPFLWEEYDVLHRGLIS